MLGKHSGRAAFRNKLEQLGYGDIGENAFQDAFVRFKDLADHKKDVTDEDIVALVDDSAGDQEAAYTLEDLKIHSIVHGVARVDVSVLDRGEVLTTEGNGAVDAIFKGIKEATGQDGQKLDLWFTRSRAERMRRPSTVRLEQDGRSVSGTGAVDTLFASARAYIHALNKLQHSDAGSTPTMTSQRVAARRPEGLSLPFSDRRTGPIVTRRAVRHPAGLSGVLFPFKFAPSRPT